MFKQYKKSLILSSLVILLPAVVGWFLRERMVFLDPWSESDNLSLVLNNVFFLPLTLLISHWLVLFLTWKDQGSKNRKVFGMVMWIMPVVSLYCSAIVFCAACGMDLYQEAIVIVPLGLLFLAIGNYLPKCQQNYTIGIRIPWTLANEENWNKTHRFGGKCWVIGSILMLLCVFLPGIWKLYGTIAVVFAIILIPIAYSCKLYLQHRSQGIVYEKIAVPGGKKGSVFLIVILIFVAITLFTGNIRYQFGESSFTIDADFYSNLTVSYDKIDSLTFQEGNVPGVRVSGFGSPRLLMGTFRNDELGSYTRYTYGRPESCVILTSGSRTLVLSGKNTAETKALYEHLLSAIQ